VPTLAELEVLLSIQDADLKKGLNALDKRLDKFEQDTEKKINRAGEAFDGFGSKATEAGQALAPLAAVIAATAGYAVKVAADYQQMGNVFAAVSQASVAEMEQVRQKAVELGSDLKLPGTSAKDAMATMVELSKAGLNVAESMDAARGSIMLAAAGQLENARAAEIQANAMNSFALAGGDAMRVADLFSKAANASSAGVEDLAQAFAMGSSTAFAAKLTIEEYTASLVAMANAGIKGSDAGTSVKTMLMSLMAPSDEAAKAMERINLSFFDGAGKARPFTDVVRDLRKELSGMTEQKQADIMKTIFGTDGIRAAQIITRLGDGFDDLVGQMDGAKGSASEMATSMNKGLLGAFDALKSSVETLLLAEGEKGLPALENTIRGIAEAVGKLGEMPDPVKNLVLGVAALVAIGAPALIAIGSMSTGIGTLVTAYSSLTAAIGVGGAAAGAGTAAGATAGFVALLSNPVTLAAIAAAAVIAGVAYAYHQVSTEGERYAKQLDEEWKVQAKATVAKLETVKAIGPLVKEYEALRGKTELSKEESKRMKEALDKIVLQAPELISAYNESGKAVDIYTDAFKRLGNAADLARQKARDAAHAAYEETAGLKDAELEKNRILQNSLRERIEALRQVKNVTDMSVSIPGNDKFVKQRQQERLKELDQAKRDMAQLIAAEEKLRAERYDLLKKGGDTNLRIKEELAKGKPGYVAPPPKDDKKDTNTGNGNTKPGGSGTGAGKPPKTPAQMAREISDEYLVALGQAVKSPGPKGDAACAMFASTVLAHYTKGLTDEGEKITWSARGLFDRVIAKGGVEVAKEAARAGDLAFRPGSGVSKLHVGLSTGDGRVMDMNGQRNGQRNQMDVGSDKGWRFLRLPDKVIDPKFLVQESEVAGQAMAAAILRPWDEALGKVIDETFEAKKQLRLIGASMEDQISLEKFGKFYSELSSETNKSAVKGLADTLKEIEEKKRINAPGTAKEDPMGWAAREGLAIIQQINESHREYMDNLAHQLDLTNANTEAERLRLAIAKEHVGWSKEQVDEAVKASMGLESARKLVERMNAPSDARGANPLWWAEGALPIIRQINEAHQEYLAGLAHENAMILANSEAERIRLELIQQYPSWTADMVDQAVSAALDVEATRQKADEIQDIVYRLTNWIDGSLDALLDDGFKGFFDEVVNGFTDMVADMAKAWIMSQMQDLFEGLIGKLIGGGGKDKAGKYASGSVPFIKGSRADGGPVDGGMPYLVGERGPEIIIPQASGHVYNNTETVSLLKAINSKQSSSLSSKVDGETTVNNVTQPVVVNVTINANDAGSFFGSERQMKQMIAQAVKDGLRR
jgi:TP901 family phage tail tape measure protein